MTGQELEALMEDFDVFDNALLYHADKDYRRDYELIVQVHVGPAPQGTQSYLFRYCVEADVRTSLPASIHRQSLDERLIDYDTGKDLDGYVWGVKWSALYPGWKRNPTSERAASWSAHVGMEVHEVEVETNAYLLTLVFADLGIQKLSDHVDAGINSTYIPLE